MPRLTASDVGLTLGREFDNEAGIRHLPLFWAEPSRVQLAFVFYRIADKAAGRQPKERNRTPSGAV
jgi:hypothetical protein